MTNFQIITNALIDNGICTKEEIEEIVKNNLPLPVHTYSVWKKNGYFVKRGEHAKLCVRIWQRKKKNKNEVIKEENIEEDLMNENTEEYVGNFFKTNAYFFGKEQVEKIGANAQ